MAADFPTLLASIARPTAQTKRNAPGYEGHVLHNNLADEVEAIEAVIGVTGSAVAGTLEKRITDVTSTANSAMPATAAAAGSLIAAAAAKPTPADADKLALSDSAASGIMRGLSWGDAKREMGDQSLALCERKPYPLPRHVNLGSVANLNLAGATVPSGVVMTTEADPYEFGGTVIKFTMSGAVSSKVVIIPLLSDLPQYPKAMPQVMWRLKYSDPVTRLYAGIGSDAAAANRHYWVLSEALPTKTPFGNNGPDRASRWVDKYRTFCVDAYRNKYTSGSAPTWDDSTPQCEVRALHLTISCTAAATVYLSRCYSPVWDKARLIVQGDGAYQSFLDELGDDMIAAGHRGVLSAIGRDRDVAGGGECSAADLRRYSDAGWDVIQHLSAVPTLTSILATTTSAQLAEYLARGSSAFDLFGVRQQFFVSCYQNTNEKTTTLTDYSTVLDKMSILMARGKVMDPEFGVQPWNDLSSYWNLDLNVITPQYYTPPNGRFNRFYHTAGQYGSFDLKNNYPGSTTETLLTRIVAAKQLGWAYFHRFYGDAGSPPADSNNTVQYAQQFLAACQSLIDAGALELTTLTDLYESTYGRQGSVFMRWDGEWALKSDPLVVAF